MKKLMTQYRVIGGVFCLFFLNCIAQAQEGETLITTSEEPVVVIDSYEAALDQNTKQSDLNIGEAVEPDFFNDIVDRIRGIFTSDDGSVEIGFLEGVFKSDTPALRIDQEGDAILQGDLTVRTVKSAGDLTVGSPEEVSNTEGKAITVGDKDRGVIELHGGDGQGVTAKGIVQTGVFGMEIGTLTDQALKLFTNQAERMTITPNGNVGIGIPSTTNPTARLEVGGDIKATDTITASSFIGDGSQLTGIEGKFTDGDTSTDAVFTTGNVGIGTTDPDVQLEIDSKGGAPNADYSVTTENAALSLASSQGGDVGIGTGTRLLSGIGGSEYVWLQSQNSLSAIDDNTKNISLNPVGGNVGIGTTNPREKLEVNEDAVRSSLDPNLDTGHTFFLRNSYENDTGIVSIGFGQRTSGAWSNSAIASISLSPGNPRLGFFTEYNNDRGDKKEKLSILNNGNVGIGTTEPNNELVVGESRMNDVAGGDPAIEVGGDRAFISLGKSNTERVQLGWNNENSEGNQYADLTTVGSSPQPLVLQRGGGNVGIGTTSPQRALDVRSLSNTPVFVRYDGKLNNDETVGVVFLDETETVNSQIRAVRESDKRSGLGFYTRNESNGTQERVRINGLGNIGIGTTSPEAKIHVKEGSIVVEATAEGSFKDYHYPDYSKFKIGGHAITLQGLGPNRPLPYIQWKTEDNRRAMYLGWGGSNYINMRLENNYNLIISGGRVGIGTNNPSYSLHVNGTAYATGKAGALSDKRHKNTVQDLDYGLSEILQLRPVSFVWNDEKITDDGMKGVQLGLIAQEIEKVLPEVVLTQEDEAQTKAIKYSALIPPMIEAIKELSAQNKALQKKNQELHHRVSALESK